MPSAGVHGAWVLSDTSLLKRGAPVDLGDSSDDDDTPTVGSEDADADNKADNKAKKRVHFSSGEHPEAEDRNEGEDDVRGARCVQHTQL